jgi:phosphatidylinositol-3-phosphatase
VTDRKDDQTPEGAGRGNCSECGHPLAADQRYCTACGHRRGILPSAVAGTIASVASTAKAAGAAASGKASKPNGDDGGGWSWMPSPPAIAIAVIGMLALGVGLGSAMSEVASSAPLSTILLEYPRHAVEAAPTETEAEEPAEEVLEEEPVVAEAPEETAPIELPPEALPEEPPAEPVTEEEELGGEPPAEEFNPFEEEETNFLEEEEKAAEEAALPQIKHAWLIVLGENSYESTFSATAGSPYLSRVLPGKGELLPHYYGVTGGVLANEIALLSGQGPTPETAANCPNPNLITPATVSVFAEQVEGNGCVYPKTVQSLPTQLEAKYAESTATDAPKVSWRAYVEDMEKGGAIGQPWRCRKPTIGLPDTTVPTIGDQYANWRNPVVYFGAVSESPECEKHDVGFELLTKDLKAKKKTPALSLIFPNACHSGGEVECEPGAAKGAQGATKLLKTLVPAIMASPAYKEGGGLIVITSAQAPQVGEHLDPSACCLAPQYPNLAPITGAPAAAVPPAATTPKAAKGEESGATEEAAGEEAAATKYGEESVLPGGGGGQVGLLMISPLVEEGKIEEAEYANHFTLLKSLEAMFGLEPLGYAGEEEVPAFSPELFLATTGEGEGEAGEGEAAETAQKADSRSRTANPSRATPRNLRMVGPVKRRDRRAPSWAPGRTPIESAIARLRP